MAGVALETAAGGAVEVTLADGVAAEAAGSGIFRCRGEESRPEQGGLGVGVLGRRELPHFPFVASGADPDRDRAVLPKDPGVVAPVAGPASDAECRMAAAAPLQDHPGLQTLMTLGVSKSAVSRELSRNSPSV